MNMFLHNPTKPEEFQGHRSKVKVTGPDFRIFLPLRDKAKKFVSAITYEPLHDDILHEHVP